MHRSAAASARIRKSAPVRRFGTQTRANATAESPFSVTVLKAGIQSPVSASAMSRTVQANKFGILKAVNANASPKKLAAKTRLGRSKLVRANAALRRTAKVHKFGVLRIVRAAVLPPQPAHPIKNGTLALVRANARTKRLVPV